MKNKDKYNITELHFEIERGIIDSSVTVKLMHKEDTVLGSLTYDDYECTFDFREQLLMRIFVAFKEWLEIDESKLIGNHIKIGEIENERF